MRIALGVEYCGANFCGWQTQSRGLTVQQALESALSKIADTPVSVVAAGRTDAGVHASGQVVHFDSPVERPDSAWVRGVNTQLPKEVAVRWAQPVGDEFHARFSATGRSYRYYLLNRPMRSAMLAGRVGWDFHPLDGDVMNGAAQVLLGRHDFSSFRAAECQANTPVRTLRRAEVRRCGAFLIFDFSADAFLHHMVRNLVGALVYVGKGAMGANDLKELLDARDRKRAPPTFMADGLYLANVEYPEAFGLPVADGLVFPWEQA